MSEATKQSENEYPLPVELLEWCLSFASNQFAEETASDLPCPDWYGQRVASQEFRPFSEIRSSQLASYRKVSKVMSQIVADPLRGQYTPVYVYTCRTRPNYRASAAGLEDFDKQTRNRAESLIIDCRRSSKKPPFKWSNDLGTQGLSRIKRVYVLPVKTDGSCSFLEGPCTDLMRSMAKTTSTAGNGKFPAVYISLLNWGEPNKRSWAPQYAKLTSALSEFFSACTGLTEVGLSHFPNGAIQLMSAIPRGVSIRRLVDESVGGGRMGAMHRALEYWDETRADDVEGELIFEVPSAVQQKVSIFLHNMETHSPQYVGAFRDPARATVQDAIPFFSDAPSSAPHTTVPPSRPTRTSPRSGAGRTGE